MPTEIEVSVMTLLSSIEIPRDAAKKIQDSGNEAVTVVCEAALGTYPGLRQKIRYNAVSLLGRMDHPQAKETIALLVNDPNPDVSIRAMRASGRQNNAQSVPKLGQILNKSESTPLVVAEAVKALLTIDSPEAVAVLQKYETASQDAYPHRKSAIVQDILSTKRSH